MLISIPNHTLLGFTIGPIPIQIHGPRSRLRSGAAGPSADDAVRPSTVTLEFMP